jgi:hypothetical protein
MRVFEGGVFKCGCFITLLKKIPTGEIEATGRTLVILTNSDLLVNLLWYWPKGLIYWPILILVSASEQNPRQSYDFKARTVQIDSWIFSRGLPFTTYDLREATIVLTSSTTKRCMFLDMPPVNRAYCFSVIFQLIRHSLFLHLPPLLAVHLRKLPCSISLATP